jgi:phosphocarrier protein FPr
MLELDTRQVRMGQRAADKDAALALMGGFLVEDGLVGEGYLAGLRAREAQGSTYLGQGIAIPHGTPDTRDAVVQTGVRLMHFPEGVDWGGGQRVYLAVGIAARSDEHLTMLQALTRVLGDDNLEKALHEATTPEHVLAVLQRAPQAILIDAQLIALSQPVDGLDDMIALAARRLRQAGCATAGFGGAVYDAAPLPLGDGLWWVHGLRNVTRPGLAFVTAQDTLHHDGHALKGLFCLATAGDGHELLLERVCELLAAGHGNALATSMTAAQILAALGAGAAPDWPTATVPLANAHGLHARPAQVLTQIAKRFDGEIRVRIASSDAAPVSVRSLSKLLSLGARRGQTLQFLAEPLVAHQALPELVAAVQSGLGEPVEPLTADDLALAEATITPDPVESLVDDTPHEREVVPPPPPGSTWHAVAASPGIAVGPAYVHTVRALTYPEHAESPDAERARLREAMHAARADLGALIHRSPVKAIREIFVTHQEMLEDPSLVEDTDARLAHGASAEAAWMATINEAARAQESLEDALLAERAADLRDVGRRVLARLCGAEEAAEPQDAYILVMEEVGPSDVARLDTARVAGILTARGGATSHSAIVARALGIPALVGAGNAVLSLVPGTPLLLDGDRGMLRVAPDTGMLARAQEERAARVARQQAADARCMEPAITRDGHAVEVFANQGDIQGTPAAIAFGAEGIGLLRTEFLFMAHAHAPDLAAQEADYRQVLDALEGRPLVVRTLDVGGDKPLPYWPIPAEDNPYLGLRGVRLTLQRPEIMETQLRALMRAADERPLRIMFPMVGSVSEWRQARDMARRVALDTPVKDLQLGIMVEVPSAALLAHVLAAEVDFFSVGTNDLTQYTLAIDRGHPVLSAQADGLHPGVLKLIDMTVKAAHAHGKWVGVCGELAADPHAVPILVGLDVDELSVSARSVPMVKARVRELDMVRTRALAQQALDLAGPAEVRALVEALD